MASEAKRDVLIVVGAGGMGVSVARRLGSGRSILIADSNATVLGESTASLRADGIDVSGRQVDVSSAGSVRDLAREAASMGRVLHLVHTAGVSPVQTTAADVIRVDLLGTALVLEEFGRVIAEGGAGVAIASMAGHLAEPLTVEDEYLLRSAPAEDLLKLPVVKRYSEGNSGLAYAMAKRANLLRVQAASVDWGARGARINSISPGIVSTSMGRLELASGTGEIMRAMIDGSACKRIGTPGDISSVAAFLLGPEASFITGTDVLVDGGVVASIRSGRFGPSA
jgi:NAD(P)-dependent dehydrogenase (short-subunit alcohol dehydrogenase family)